MLVLGKAASFKQCVNPHSAAQEWALGLEHFLTKRESIFTAYDGLIALCWKVFPCFRLHLYPSALHKDMCQWPSGTSSPFCIPDSTGNRLKSFHCSMKLVEYSCITYVGCVNVCWTNALQGARSCALSLCIS